MNDFNLGIAAKITPGDTVYELMSEEEKMYAAVHDVVVVRGKHFNELNLNIFPFFKF